MVPAVAYGTFSRDTTSRIDSSRADSSGEKKTGKKRRDEDGGFMLNELDSGMRCLDELLPYAR